MTPTIQMQELCDEIRSKLTDVTADWYVELIRTPAHYGGESQDITSAVCALFDQLQALRDENAALRMQLRCVAGSTVSLEPPE
jgi:hypothetical protein